MRPTLTPSRRTVFTMPSLPPWDSGLAAPPPKGLGVFRLPRGENERGHGKEPPSIRGADRQPAGGVDDGDDLCESTGRDRFVQTSSSRIRRQRLRSPRSARPSTGCRSRAPVRTTVSRPLQPLPLCDMGGRCRSVTGHSLKSQVEWQLSITTNAYSRPTAAGRFIPYRSFSQDHLITIMMRRWRSVN